MYNKEEVWKDIAGWEGMYQVSNMGNIKALSKTVYYSDGRVYNYPEKILKISNTGHRRYCTVHFYSNTIRHTYQIHRLVAQAFIPNPENKPTVNHIDGNKRNNQVSNLEWSTYGENNAHALITGLKEQTPSGIKSNLSALTGAQVREIIDHFVPNSSGKYSSRYFADKFGVTTATIRKYYNNRDFLSKQLEEQNE